MSTVAALHLDAKMAAAVCIFLCARSDNKKLYTSSPNSAKEYQLGYAGVGLTGFYLVLLL